jgi:hypothetical protein
VLFKVYFDLLWKYELNSLRDVIMVCGRLGPNLRRREWSSSEFIIDRSY